MIRDLSRYPGFYRSLLTRFFPHHTIDTTQETSFDLNPDVQRNIYRGFTLIELMVVVFIIGIISAVLIPLFLGSGGGEGISQEEEKTAVGQSAPGIPPELPTPPELAAIVPVTESADVSVKLKTTNILYRLQVYTLYEASFEGHFVFGTRSDQEERVKLEFPFPEGTTQAKDVSLQFFDSSGQWEEPDGVFYSLEGISWFGPLSRDETLEAKVTYGAQGRDKFVYEGPGAGRAGSFKLELTLEGVTSEFIPAETLKPTLVEPHRLMWDFENLITDRKIIVELPGTLSPIGRVILLSKLAGFAVLLFGAGFLYMSELSQPGRLDNFRLGHFLLLALNYFLFFIIVMVLSLGGEVEQWLAIGLSALFSLPLLMVHTSRVLDRRFAFYRVLPLTVFTLAIVINGVYGEDFRNHVFVAFVVVAVAFLTLTYDTWSEKKGRYLEQKKFQAEEETKRQEEAKREEEREKQIVAEQNSLHQSAIKAVKKVNERLLRAQTLEAEAKLLLDREEAQGHLNARKEVEGCLSQLTDLFTKDPALSSRPDEVTGISDIAELRVVCSTIERDGVLQFQRLGSAMDLLRKAMDNLKQLREREEIRVRKGKDLRCCIACGTESPLSAYCPECGILRPLELVCDKCGELYRYPRHLISPEKAGDKIHCMACGKELDIPLKDDGSKTQPERQI
ncbi:MAG: prepilin-type N-terminal cleavage/methylation domain-containing protein [Acidobacteriota bacterium]